MSANTRLSRDREEGWSRCTNWLAAQTHPGAPAGLSHCFAPMPRVICCLPAAAEDAVALSSPRHVSPCRSCPFTPPQYASCTLQRMTTSFCPRKASLNSPFLTKSLSTSFLAVAHKLLVLILACSSTYSLIHHIPVSFHFLPFHSSPSPSSDTSLHTMLSSCSLNGFLPWKNSIKTPIYTRNSILK